jgi:type IV pilus assembly protein PilP
MSATPALRPSRAQGRSRAAVSAAAVAVATLLAHSQGCGPNAPPPPPITAAPPSTAPKASASASASAAPQAVFNESEFQESDSSRDPFHNYLTAFAPSKAVTATPQYDVLLRTYSVDELRLVAIVTTGDGVRAMFIDPVGKGWTVQRGQHIGRGEMVKLGDKYQSSYPLYWKVDRIKDGEVVLIREDSLHPEMPPTYREIPLHLEAEKT